MKTNHALLAESTDRKMPDILSHEGLKLRDTMKRMFTVNASSATDLKMETNLNTAKLLTGCMAKERLTTYFKNLKCFVNVRLKILLTLLKPIETKSMILNKICVHDKYFREKAKQIAGVDGDDLVQEMYLKLHRYNKEKLNDIIKNGVVKYLGVRMINQLFLDQKRKQKEFLGLTEIKQDEPTIDERILKVKEIVANQHWYDQEIWNIYMDEDLTMRDIAKQTGIPLCEIWATINKLKTKIKSEL